MRKPHWLAFAAILFATLAAIQFSKANEVDGHIKACLSLAFTLYFSVWLAASLRKV